MFHRCGTNPRNGVQVGQKRGREESEDARFQAEARAAVRAFLRDFAALPAEQAPQQVQALRADLQARAADNPVLRGMLTTASR